MRVPGSGPSYSTLALPSYTRRRLFILRILVPAFVLRLFQLEWRTDSDSLLKLQHDSPCCSARKGPGARLERGADSSRTSLRKQSKHLGGCTGKSPPGHPRAQLDGPSSIDCDGSIG